MMLQAHISDSAGEEDPEPKSVFVACDAYNESDYSSEPDYYSSEDSDSDAPHQEVYAGK